MSVNPRTLEADFIRLKATIGQYIRRDSDLGLEVGPFDRPFFTTDETNVRYLDYRSTEDTRVAAAVAPGHSAAWVADIDYVVPASGDWGAVPDASFDWILSSHALEHSPDLIGFLRTMESKLKPGGVIVTLLPDKRRTFDAYRPISTVGKVFEDYMNQAKRPSLQSVIDSRFYPRSVGIEVAEQTHFASAVSVVEGVDIAACLQVAEESRTRYVDTHNYVFTPASFETIIRQVILSGALRSHQVAHIPTPEGEMTFMNILRKDS